MLLQVNALKLFLGLHYLLMLLLLQSVEAVHENGHGEENSDHDHEEKERLVIGVVRRKFRLNLHFIRHVVEDLLANRVTEGAQPVRVVKNYKHIVVNLVLGQKDRIT